MRSRSGAATVFLIALAALLLLIVVGEIQMTIAGLDLRLRYKEAARALALAWLACQAMPAARAAVPYLPRRADLPLALFAAAAALSVALGGGRWGSVRHLLAAIGIGLLARALFTPAAHRARFLHYLGALVVAVLARELAANPSLLPPRELGRYLLVTANPNVLGFLFAMLAPVLLAEVTAARGRRRIAAACYLGGAVLGTLMTFSRTAALGLALGTLLVLLSERRRAGALAVGVLALAAFLAVQRPDLWSASRAGGDADRLRIMRTSLDLAAEAPVLGVGFGGHNLEPPFRARYAERYGEPVFRYHSANQVVDLLAQTGVVGTGLALWWAAALGADARRRLGAAAAGAARRRAAGGLAALVTVGVMSLAEPPLDHGKLLPVLFLLLEYAALAPADEDAA